MPLQIVLELRTGVCAQSTHAMVNDMIAADIRVIDLEAIVSGDQAQCHELMLACSKEGFFYLDYSSQQDIQWQDTMNHVRMFYNQDLNTKLRYWRGRNKTGYKPLGIDPGVGEATKDGYENFRVGRSVSLRNH